MLSDVIILWGGQEVTAMDVYRNMFQFGEVYLQKEHEHAMLHKAIPISYWKND